MINNRISDIISRIRNTIKSTKNGLIYNQKDSFNSKEILEILAKLGELGFIKYEKGNWYLNTHKNTNIPILENIKGRSTSGKRMYRGNNFIKENEIVRTSKGILIGYEARKEKRGGEILMKVERSGIIK